MTSEPVNPLTEEERREMRLNLNRQGLRLLDLLEQFEARAARAETEANDIRAALSMCSMATREDYALHRAVQNMSPIRTVDGVTLIPGPSVPPTRPSDDMQRENGIYEVTYVDSPPVPLVPDPDWLDTIPGLDRPEISE